MIPKPSSCQGCPLYEGPCGKKVGYSLPVGEMNGGVAIVAEALGEAEEIEGMPLVGKSGYALFQHLARVDIRREEFRLLNTIFCRPPDNKLVKMPYEQAAINQCRPVLDAALDEAREMAMAKGKTFTIICLGVTPFKRILNLQDGDPILKEDTYGYPFWSDRYKAWVYHAPHPAYLVRGNTHLWPVIQFVFKRALEVADKGLTLDSIRYEEDPPAKVFHEWVDTFLSFQSENPDLILSHDIETPYKKKSSEEDLGKEDEADHTINRVSFAYKWEQEEPTVVSIPWTTEYLSDIERLYGSNAVLLGWNSDNYDNPRIRKHVEIQARCVDGMVAWHILNTSLPKGLGFVTPYYWQNTLLWKHLSDTQPAYYNAKDSHAALVNYLGIKQDLITNKLWHVFENHVLKLNQALTYMSGQGVLLDKAMRQEAEESLSKKLTEIEVSMEEAVPQEARKLKIFKKTPSTRCTSCEGKGTTTTVETDGTKLKLECPVCQGKKRIEQTEGLIQVEQSIPEKYCGVCGLYKPTKHHAKDCPSFVGEVEEMGKYCSICGIKDPTKTHKKACPLTSTITRMGLVPRYNVVTLDRTILLWAKPLEFKVSKVGLTNYQKALRHQAIVSREKKVTFNEDAIMRLMKTYPKDPLYPKILSHRKTQKLLSTYVGVTNETGKIIGGMPTGSDGRIHPTYTHNPSTLRFACEDPNMQNLPRPTSDPNDPYNIIRNLIVASPGHTLVARDFSGIEAVLCGYFMADPGYIRLAKQDIHTYYTVHALYELEGGARVKSYDLPNLEWPNERLFPYLEELKKQYKTERNNLYKHLVHACVTGDHEVLTPRGWVRFDQLENGVQVAQWETDSTLSFVTPTVTRAPFDGNLVSWKGQAFSLDATPNHRLPVVSSYGTVTESVVSDTLHPSLRIPTAGVLDGKDTICHEIIQLLVAIQADATLYGNHVVFHLVKERKKTRLLQLLNTLGYVHTVTDCKCHEGGVKIRFNLKKCVGDWWTNYLLPGKTFNLTKWMALDVACKKVFINEIPLWDGSVGGRSGKQTVYVTANRDNAITVQTLAHLVGKRSLIRECPPGQLGHSMLYKVSLSDRVFVGIGGLTQTTHPHQGEVYCVTVPSSWFLMRHQGVISVTGNSNFMQGPKGAQAKIFLETGVEYPLKTVAKVMDIYYSLFPTIRRWHKAILEEAEKEGYLRNPFGYVHRFSRPFEYKKEFGDWTKKPGPDANKCIAFKPQSTAAGIIKEALMRLYFNRFEEAGQYLRLQVHDELFLEVPEERWVEVSRIVKEEMERPIPEMRLPASWGMGEFLSINTEAKKGSRWGGMKGFSDTEVHPPTPTLV